MKTLIRVILIMAIWSISPAFGTQAQETVTVTASQTVNLREGPGTQHAVAGQLKAGEEVLGVGRNLAGDWLHLPGGEWVAAWVVNVTGDIDALPIDTFTLTILHTNDTHCAFGPQSYVDTALRPDPDGTGGAARALTYIKQVRAERSRVLLLDGGDFFSPLHCPSRLANHFDARHGLFFGHAQIFNLLGYDAAVVGNHELFEAGPDGLVRLMEMLDFPVLSANFTDTNFETLQAALQPYIIREIDGRKVGIIGLSDANPDSYFFDPPVVLKSEEDAAREMVQELESQGVDIIIILSQIVFDEFITLAERVDGIDLVVNGFGQLGDTYPYTFITPSGKTALGVHSMTHFSGMGRIDVEFDENGDIVAYEGDLVELEKAIPQDPAVTELLKWLLVSDPESLSQTVIGELSTTLESGAACFAKECALGNLYADVIREATGAALAVVLMRSSRPTAIEAGPVTPKDLLRILVVNLSLNTPMNELLTIQMTGAELVAMLESGLKEVEPPPKSTDFLHVSGFSYTWDGSRPIGDRVTDVMVAGEALDLEAIYNVSMNEQTFTRLAESAFDAVYEDLPIYYALLEYFQTHATVTATTEGRITRIDE